MPRGDGYLTNPVLEPEGEAAVDDDAGVAAAVSDRIRRPRRYRRTRRRERWETRSRRSAAAVAQPPPRAVGRQSSVAPRRVSSGGMAPSR